MLYFYAALAVIGIPFLVLGVVFEYWKKLWLTSEGQVVAAEIPKRSQRRSGAIKVSIHYCYSYRGIRYDGTESKSFEIEYHQEQQALFELQNQFPVGGKIIVFHPQSVPSLSSITPGGANMFRLVFCLLLAIGLLVLVHYMNKLR